MPTANWFRLEVIKMKPVDVMWVGLGGGLGSVLRWWIGRLVGEGYKGLFPLGTGRITSAQRSQISAHNRVPGE